MPKVALADTLLDWELLIAAARERFGDRPELKPFLEQLQERLDRARELDRERKSLEARRQQATQDLGEVRDQGKQLAIRTRAILKGLLGSSDEGLTQFKIRPRRPYGKRQASPAKPAPSRKTRRTSTPKRGPA